MTALSPSWHKSTRSNNAGECVEARRLGDAVQLRDSKDPGGPIVAFTHAGWESFVADAKRGAFDLT